MKYISSVSAFYIFIILELWTGIQADVFSAISDIEPLLETYKKIIDDLGNYIEKEDKRLHVLKKKVDLFRKEHDIAMEDPPNYLGNPINAFTLIKRLTSDLNFIEKSIEDGTEYIKDITVNDTDVKYPTVQDLTGAALALTRLQRTYRLDIADLAKGRINGITHSSPMTAGDCYELGRTLCNVNDYENSLSWMMEALTKYKETDGVFDFTEVEILENISYLHYLLGNGEKAYNWTYKLLLLDPDNQHAISNIPNYFKIIAEKKERLEKNSTEEIGEPKIEGDANNEWENTYHTLCRGEMDLPHEISRRLKCSYLTENHAFLKIAPIKTEQVYIDPDIFLFHQVLSNEEIEHIKDGAKPLLKRATVRKGDGEPKVSTNRISKSAWLTDEESSVVARVSRRVADFTGLSISSAESLQIVNYGVGGHYAAHYDFIQKHEAPYESGNGNRIATVLFYMSDVAQGGATVFSYLGLSVFPVKNAAVFWLNLYPSGEGDVTTLHAACPVLQGSKWVANKWIHLKGQEFLKPCNLKYQQEEDMRDIIKAVPRTL